MDSLNFFKFWRPTTNTNISDLLVETYNEFDEEDSFFDLELTVPDFDTKENNDDNHPEDKTTTKGKKQTKEEAGSVSAKKVGDCELSNSKPTFSVSVSDPISKRKILPIEPSFKPQSPIALLKSAPKFRIFMFKKPKSMKTQKTEEIRETEFNKGSMETQKQQSKVFSKLTSPRDNSLRSNGSKPQYQNVEGSKSDRFSKDVIQKYLKLIKPIYVKISKRYSDKIKFSDELSLGSPASSPSMAPVSSSKRDKQGNLPAGIRIVCKHLGKSKSSMATIGIPSPENRRDDTLQQQHDGIQSAIMHCKRSFSSSRDSALSSPEKSMDSLRKSFEEEKEAGI
ncbi:putative Membrane-associated kinase regulator [Quillaja saponaria]|uniref:Membrane-associated kinase regulator n=1 Tax=Quillaja saponaria TaxID=32244 RepID=A0AAD7M4L3_QUISA|nr:putative Membrane-associated kinase regulator [Quillaja saponaria]